MLDCWIGILSSFKCTGDCFPICSLLGVLLCMRHVLTVGPTWPACLNSLQTRLHVKILHYCLLVNSASDYARLVRQVYTLQPRSLLCDNARF
jgi:hypothetical protein